MKYENLNEEAQVLFDYILEFWNDVQEGEEFSALEYADAESAEKMFKRITKLTIEDIDLNGV